MFQVSFLVPTLPRFSYWTPFKGATRTNFQEYPYALCKLFIISYLQKIPCLTEYKDFSLHVFVVLR